MDTADDEINKSENCQPEDEADFLKEFIERKKLENRILQKIIDNIRPPEPEDKTTKHNEKSES